MSTYSKYFNEDHEMFRQGLRTFLDKEVMPYIDEWEENRRTPHSIWKKMGEMGYLGLNYPEKYGGMEADFFYSVVFMEEVSRCFSGGFAVAPLVMQYMSTPYIYKYGSEFLKEKYLAKTIAGESVSCIAITEPGAGSDAANIQTRAIRNGDHYVVNGAKTFITNAYFGDYLIAVVKTDPEKGVNGVSLLVIDLKSEGVSARKLKKLGWHASDTAELNFDDVKVPVENLIGEEGQGFYYLMGGLQLERLAGAVSAIAGCEHALEYALKYMGERKAFGRTINKFQVLRHRVAQLATEIESAKAFTYHLCELHNEGKYAVKECSMAKLLATELSDKTMYQCLQFFGGYGYMEEYKIARLFRDSRILTIGGGSSEIMREIISKMVIDEKNYKQAQLAEAQANGSTNGNGSAEDPFDKIYNIIEKNASSARALGNTLQFDLEGQHIFINGKGDANSVSKVKHDADCTISLAKEDFLALLKGQMNPMTAMMSGKLKIDGDMGVAMKLQSLMN